MTNLGMILRACACAALLGAGAASTAAAHPAQASGAHTAHAHEDRLARADARGARDALTLAAAATPRETGDLRAAIDSQIAAFGQDDFDAAFGYASPQIRRHFGTPENFGEMVRSAYPMVHRPARYSFGQLEEIGGRQRQSVVITDTMGRVWIADYDMIEIDGAWRIDGVRLRKAERLGV